LASTGSQLSLENNLLALLPGQTIRLNAALGINQTEGLIRATNLDVNNGKVANPTLPLPLVTPTPVVLTSAGNDVDQLAIRNVGAVTYVDANDFETGIDHVNSGATVTEAIVGDVVSLSAVGPRSVIRVVGGINYENLTIQAGGGTDASRGLVEFVVTNEGDNPTGLFASPDFAGTLRDMIEHVNDNAARVVTGGSLVPQAMAIVFDEAAYPVDELTVNAQLPTITNPVLLDGSRVEDSLLPAPGSDIENVIESQRVAIRGRSGIASGLVLGEGSDGSVVTSLAVYGFRSGSGITIESSGNLVTDSYLGLNRDGAEPNTALKNRNGITLSGPRASSNRIGASNSLAGHAFVGWTAFDADTANLIGGNRDAGILIESDARGNVISGNLVGVDRDGGDIGNRIGIQVRNARGNRIGTSDQVLPTLSEALNHEYASNRIANNDIHGIWIHATNGGDASINRVVNNEIISNGVHGIYVSDSSAIQLGGVRPYEANVIGNQGGSGIFLMQSNGIEVRGNFLGTYLVEEGFLTPGESPIFGEGFPERLAADFGNNGDGITVAGRSRDVRIDGNRIAGNSGDGIGIQLGSTAVVMTNNTIGDTADGGAGGNDGGGISIDRTIGNIVGQGNRISGNAVGIAMTGANAPTTVTGNRVLGSDVFANLGHGIQISGSSRNTIGGYDPSDANWILQNGDANDSEISAGVQIEDNARYRLPATGNIVRGNYIGTSEYQEVDTTYGNEVGVRMAGGQDNLLTNNVIMNNAASGVELAGGTSNRVGGMGELDGNVIAANAGHGVYVHDGADDRLTRGHEIMANVIEVNNGDGVFVEGRHLDANNDRILDLPQTTVEISVGEHMTNGQVSGRPNIIHGNGGYGVRVNGAKQVSVQGNSIAENTSGGLELENNANWFSGYALTLVDSHVESARDGTTRVTGYVYGEPLDRYVIDIYSNPYYDFDRIDPTTGQPAGYQMRTFVGRAMVVAGEDGWASFAIDISEEVEVGDVVSITATSLRYGIGSTTAPSNHLVHDLSGDPDHSTPSLPSGPPPVTSTPPSSNSPRRGPVPPSQR